MKQYTSGEKAVILAKLAEPFDPEDIKWLPKIVNKGQDSAMGLAYADPRVYIDRLNDVVGSDGWQQQIVSVIPAVGYSQFKKGWGEKPDTNITGQGKLMVVCRVCIDSLGFHEDGGESDITDENCMTVACAQAFKRACVSFGLGRYLYDLPKDGWYPYDKKTRQITNPPELPDWALPKYVCEDTGQPIKPATVQGKYYRVSDLVKHSRQKYGQILSLEAMMSRAKKAKEGAPQQDLQAA